MPDVWYENPPGTAPALGLYSYAGLSRGGTLAQPGGRAEGAWDGLHLEIHDVSHAERRHREIRRDLFPKQFGSENYPPNMLLIVSRLVKPEFMVEVEAVVAVQR
jgi:hypothetical protein